MLLSSVLHLDSHTEDVVARAIILKLKFSTPCSETSMSVTKIKTSGICLNILCWPDIATQISSLVSSLPFKSYSACSCIPFSDGVFHSRYFFHPLISIKQK